ncbi:MAG TPA: V-type ATP synthase subunit E family protein [Thermoplasmata archaeon]|jgi:vacuolar-type H+-ATPase subunit E/Vma4|nr:V-type ATP synthase subunit E family protein [Thermoplasmata archaeon]
MSLESLVDEIRRRGEAELAAIEAGRATAAAQIAADRDRRIEAVRQASAHATELEIARTRAQRLAAAKLRARKLLYEAREARMHGALEETRTLLAEFTRSPAYPIVLKRMVAAASDALGKQLRISGRAEDAAALQKAAGKAFDPAPRAILGGLVAETPDGSRRLNLSFDELLRLREDRVRELLA